MPGFRTRPVPADPMVGAVGCQVQGPADAVPSEVTENVKAPRLDEALDGMADVTDPVPRRSHGEAHIQALSSDVKQLGGFGGNSTDADGDGGVSMATSVDETHIHHEDVTVPQHPRTGDTVKQLVVDRGAQRCGKHPPLRAVPLERRPSSP